MMTKLVEYLASLNTSENQWSLYVNPENVDDYRIGQDCFENGGLLDNKIQVASLDRVSFGFQSTREAIGSFLVDSGDAITYKNKTVKLNKDGILEAYSNGYLGSEFTEFLETQAEAIEKSWSVDEAEFWVYDTLPTILAERAEWLTEMTEILETSVAA